MRGMFCYFHTEEEALKCASDYRNSRYGSYQAKVDGLIQIGPMMGSWRVSVW